MPKSGSVKTYYKSYQGIELYWVEQSINTTNKTISIKYELRHFGEAKAVAITDTQQKLCELQVGSYTADVSVKVDCPAGAFTKVLQSGSISVPYGSNIKLSFNIGFHTAGVTAVEGSGTATVSKPFNNVSTLTAAKYTNVIGTAASFTIENASSTGSNNYLLTHTLTYKLAHDNTTGTIATGVSNVGVTWNIPNTLHSKLKDRIETECTYTLTTYFNGLLLGTSTSKGAIKVDVNKCKPVPTVFLYVSDAVSVDLTGSEYTIINGVSTLVYAASATAQYGASIVSYEAKNGTQKKTGQSGAFEKATNNTVEITVTDSRGITGTITESLTMLPYAPPTCNLKAENPDTQGRTTLTIDGSLWYKDFGLTTNNITVEYRMKDGSWGAWEEAGYASYTSTGYQVTTSIGGLDYQTGYTFQARATDKINTVYSAEVSVKSIPIFDWGAEDFNFNVPVSFQGDFMQDMIIESGTEAMGSNGTWYWYKWQSGRAECFGVRNYGNMGTATAWGALYLSEIFNQSLPTGLFKAAPHFVSITPMGTSTSNCSFICQGNSAPTKDSTGNFYVARAVNGTMGACKLGFHCLGFWK